MLYCERVTDEMWQCFCEGCGVRTDLVDKKYLSWFLYVGRHQSAHFCFECDPRGAGATVLPVMGDPLPQADTGFIYPALHNSPRVTE